MNLFNQSFVCLVGNPFNYIISSDERNGEEINQRRNGKREMKFKYRYELKKEEMRKMRERILTYICIYKGDK